jgi:hypothetical protein
MNCTCMFKKCMIYQFHQQEEKEIQSKSLKGLEFQKVEVRLLINLKLNLRKLRK